MNTTAIAFCLSTALTACSDLLAQAPEPAREPAAAAPLPANRVLVMVRGDGDHEDLGRRIAETLGDAIRDAGFQVQDGEQIEQLARRQQHVAKSAAEGMDRVLEREMAMLSRCDVIARVTVDSVRQRKQQGRYTVRQSASFKLVYADSAELLGSGEGRGDGRTLDSYDEAHRIARKQLTDPDQPDSLAGRMLARLRKARAEELEKGARLTVALHADARCQPLLAEIGKALASADGVVPGSYRQLSSTATMAAGGGERVMSPEAELRCRGNVASLQASVLQVVRKVGKAAEEEHGLDLLPVVVATGRRLDVEIRVGKAQPDLNQEVERVIEAAVDTIFGRHGTALTKKRMAVVPASIGAASQASAAIASFRTAYLNKYAEIEARLEEQGQGDKDPRSASGVVTVDGRQFPSLVEAESELDRMQNAFDESTAGSLANDIAKLVEKNFDAISKGGITIQPLARDRERAVDFIRVEAAAGTDDGAVDADTIAFYQQNGSDFLVSTRLRRFLDEFAVTVTVQDLGSGERMQGSASFHPRFTEKLRQHLGS